MRIDTLADVLDVCDEGVTVKVMDMDWETIATYDGRNSIPADLNDRAVRLFRVCSTGVVVIVW